MAAEVEDVRPVEEGFVPVSQGGRVVTSRLDVRKMLSPSSPRALRRERLVRSSVVLRVRASWSRDGCVFCMWVAREEGKYSSLTSSQIRGAGGEVRMGSCEGWSEGTNRSRLRRKGWSLGDWGFGPWCLRACSAVGR